VDAVALVDGVFFHQQTSDKAGGVFAVSLGRVSRDPFLLM
jgi:hypothetical protein